MKNQWLQQNKRSMVSKISFFKISRKLGGLIIITFKKTPFNNNVLSTKSIFLILYEYNIYIYLQSWDAFFKTETYASPPGISPNSTQQVTKSPQVSQVTKSTSSKPIPQKIEPAKQPIQKPIEVQKSIEISPKTSTVQERKSKDTMLLPPPPPPIDSRLVISKEVDTRFLNLNTVSDVDEHTNIYMLMQSYQVRFILN